MLLLHVGAKAATRPVMLAVGEGFVRVYAFVCQGRTVPAALPLSVVVMCYSCRHGGNL